LSYCHPRQSWRRPGWRCRARWFSGSCPLSPTWMSTLNCMQIQIKIP
jgi:hypothetical protein